MTEKLLLTPAEVAEALSLSRSTTYARIADGTIRSVKVGNSVRVPVAVVRELARRGSA